MLESQWRFLQNFPHSFWVLQKPYWNCCCYCRANLDAPCCTERREGRGAVFKGFTRLKRGLWHINSPFQVQKSSFPLQHHPYPYWFHLPAAAPQQADTKQSSRGDGCAQPWSPGMSSSLSPKHRRNTNSHQSSQLSPTPSCSPRRGRSCLRRG